MKPTPIANIILILEPTHCPLFSEVKRPDGITAEKQEEIAEIVRKKLEDGVNTGTAKNLVDTQLCL